MSQWLNASGVAAGLETTRRWPCRSHGPSAACWPPEPATRRACVPSGRATQTSVRTPPPVATAAPSHAPSGDHRTDTTGSSDSSMSVAVSTGSPSSCTHSCGVPLRSLM